MCPKKMSAKNNLYNESSYDIDHTFVFPLKLTHITVLSIGINCFGPFVYMRLMIIFLFYH